LEFFYKSNFFLITSGKRLEEGSGDEKLGIAGDFLLSYTKVEAGYKLPHTTETLIYNTVCFWRFLFV